jgi:hypothetical protein
MFTEALNAPWVLIILYGILLYATVLNVVAWHGREVWTKGTLAGLVLALLLIGAGLALLGAAYLHDVWYC